MMRSRKPSSNLHLRLGAAGGVALFSLLAASTAHAQTKTTLYTDPTLTTAPATVETVYELGNYDPYPATHAAYAITPDPVSLSMLAPINGPTIDACPAPQQTYDWDREWKKADDFGNSTFGAGYYAGLLVSSRAGRAGGPDTFSGEALLRGYITVFGSDKDIVRISGKAQLTGSQGSSNYYVRVLGATVRSGSAAGNLSGYESLYNASFFSTSKWIWLGPVPVKFTGAIRGTVGVNYLAQYAQSTLSVEAKPEAKLYAYASAGVDMWLASAGVSGTLTLVEASVPSKAQAIVSPTAVTYGVDSDLKLASLSGKIEAYATLPGKRWKMTLASWAPLYNATFPIKHLRSCQNPIIRPVCGDLVCQSGETHDICASDCAAPPPPPPDGDDGPLPAYCESKPWMCSDL